MRLLSFATLLAWINCGVDIVNTAHVPASLQNALQPLVDQQTRVENAHEMDEQPINGYEEEPRSQQQGLFDEIDSESVSLAERDDSLEYAVHHLETKLDHFHQVSGCNFLNESHSIPYATLVSYKTSTDAGCFMTLGYKCLDKDPVTGAPIYAANHMFTNRTFMSWRSLSSSTQFIREYECFGSYSLFREPTNAEIATSCIPWTSKQGCVVDSPYVASTASQYGIYYDKHRTNQGDNSIQLYCLNGKGALDLEVVANEEPRAQRRWQWTCTGSSWSGPKPTCAPTCETANIVNINILRGQRANVTFTASAGRRDNGVFDVTCPSGYVLADITRLYNASSSPTIAATTTTATSPAYYSQSMRLPCVNTIISSSARYRCITPCPNFPWTQYKHTILTNSTYMKTASIECTQKKGVTTTVTAVCNGVGWRMISQCPSALPSNTHRPHSRANGNRPNIRAHSNTHRTLPPVAQATTSKAMNFGSFQSPGVVRSNASTCQFAFTNPDGSQYIPVVYAAAGNGNVTMNSAQGSAASSANTTYIVVGVLIGTLVVGAIIGLCVYFSRRHPTPLDDSYDPLPHQA